METNPFHQSENADSSKGNREGNKSGNFSFVPIPASVERPSPKPVEVQRPVERLPLEGVIDWRRSDDEARRRIDDEKSETSNETKDEDDDSKEDSSKGKASAKRAVPVQAQPEHPIAEPRPLAEVIAELHAEQEDRKTEIPDGEPVAEAPHTVRAAEAQPEGEVESVTHVRPQPARQPAPDVHSLGAFPPVAERTAYAGQPRPAEIVEQSQQPEAEPAVPAAAPASHETPYVAPVAEAANEHIWYNADEHIAVPDTDQQPVTQQYFGPARVVPTAANVYQSPTSANMGSNQPPAQPGYNYNQTPGYNPNDPAFANTGYNAAPSLANPNAAPVMPIERPPVSNGNRDPRVGPVAALLGLEYLARKRADRKLEHRVNERSDDRIRQLEQSRAVDQRIMQERQRQFATEQQRQTDEMQRMRYAQEQIRPNMAESQYAGGLLRPFEAAPSGPAEYARANNPANRYEPPRPMSAPNHTERMVAGQEVRQPVPNPNTEAQPIEGQENVQDADKNKRVEHSAWHNIVVDGHGHEVAGAIQYGEGFQRERQQEAIRDRIADNVPAGSTGASGGGMIAAGSPMQDQYGNPLHPGVLPSGMTNPALPQGQGHASPNHQLPANTGQPSNIANPWLWIMILLIAAAFFTAALI